MVLDRCETHIHDFWKFQLTNCHHLPVPIFTEFDKTWGTLDVKNKVMNERPKQNMLTERIRNMSSKAPAWDMTSSVKPPWPSVPSLKRRTCTRRCRIALPAVSVGNNRSSTPRSRPSSIHPRQRSTAAPWRCAVLSAMRVWSRAGPHDPSWHTGHAHQTHL